MDTINDDDIKKLALELANRHDEGHLLTVERAEAYVAFLQKRLSRERGQ